MELPLLTVDLIRKLDEEFPARNVRATDYEDKAAEARMLMYAGKRELIEVLLDSLSEDTETLPKMN
jgi:hypothetical protein